MDTDELLDNMAQLFREAVLSHINDIAIDKGLGPPEFYYVSVEDKKIVDGAIEIKLSISGSKARYGNRTPLYLYITERIGTDQWNEDIMRVIAELAKKMNLNFIINIETKIDPLLFDMYMYAR